MRARTSVIWFVWPFAFLAVIVAVFAACSSPSSRIRDRKAEFDAYPPLIQAEIRAGRVEVGFTPEQVTLALGKPDREYVRKTASGAQDVWGYGAGSSRPRMGLNLGMGSWGGGGSYSGGVGVESEAGHDERARIVFKDDRVVSVERLQN